MIVVVGRVRTDEGKRADLMRIGLAVAAASREEGGCISYRIYEAVDAENVFVVVEEWDSDEALKRHFATPHVAEFMQALPTAIVEPPDVKFHTIASSMDLTDVSVGT